MIRCGTPVAVSWPTAILALISARAEPRIPPDTAWHPVQDLPPTAVRPRARLPYWDESRPRAKPSDTNIGFALALKTFTIAKLRDIYAVLRGSRRSSDQP